MSTGRSSQVDGTDAAVVPAARLRLAGTESRADMPGCAPRSGARCRSAASLDVEGGEPTLYRA
jgi:hypothetical protein